MPPDPSEAAPAARRPRTRPRPRRRNRDAEVLQAAITVFWRKGYAHASVQDLADEVGVLKGSLYYYIDSKQDLLMRVFDLAHEQAVEIMEEVTALDVPPIERLRIYFERHVRWYLENLEHVGVFFREWRSLTGEHREVVRRRRREYERFIEGLILDCRGEGDIAAGPLPAHLLRFVLSATGSAPDWYRADGPDAPGEIAATFADLTVGTLVGSAGAAKARKDGTWR